MGERAVGRHAADAEALVAGHDGGGPRDQEPGPALRSVTQVSSLAFLLFSTLLFHFFRFLNEQMRHKLREACPECLQRHPVNSTLLKGTNLVLR